MKKVLILISLSLILFGCGKYDEEELIKDFKNNVENASGYHIKGVLEIYRNEELYTYDVDSVYQSKDKFRVSLINQTNNHEQIILRNTNGVYVLTPALNKSFKFESDWPYNNSQIYLLQPIIKDIEKEDKVIFEKTDDLYILTVKVTYDNDTNLKKQKIYFDKDLNLTKIEVLDNSDVAKMIFTISEYDLNVNYEDKYFDVGDNYQNNIEENDNNNGSDTNNDNVKNTSKIDDIVYPMYIPVNTYLSNQDNISTDEGERVILTFSGESPFLLVQETANMKDSINYVYGDPYLISDTIGAVNDYSVSWINNGIEYSVVSDNMDVEQLITVAESISTVSVGK